MSGMKKSPLLAAATMLALTGLRMVCISMLVSTMLAMSGKLSTCHLKAAEPTATTAASSRKILMMEVEKMKPRRADAVLDRIVHHSLRVELFGESIRKRKAKSENAYV